MRVVNTDALSHLKKSLDKCIQTAENENKKKYTESCLQQRHQFTPLVVSVDGIPNVEADYMLKRISIRLATKCKKPYSRMCGYVKSMVAIILARVTHRCIWGAWMLAHKISVQRPQWEYGTSLHLFR